MAKLNLNKRQFNYCKNIVFKKEIEIKNKFTAGIKQLIIAKDIFEEANSEMHSFVHFFLNCNPIPDAKLVNARLVQDFHAKDDLFDSLWKIKVEPKIFEFDLTKDKVYGKIAKKKIEEEEQTVSFQYNRFYIS
mmetsp:Transcript_18248/g.16137  ORF Transcript_18248/g.16137 Transcript_18248/m.16137 type:complete len:133 (+) Transcript_18248:56-454(+)